MLVTRFFIISTLVIFFGLTSCQLKSKENLHVLVLAFDQLDFESINCFREHNKTSGLDILCDNSVRFTNAYSTSVLTLPSMVSLLTGLYPFEHAVHTSNQFLSPKYKTVAEIASQQGFKTYFYTANPEVLFKNGIYQGFYYFEDGLSLNRPTKTLKENLQVLIKNITSSKKENTFHLVHASDLYQNHEPELEALDNVLFDFFTMLKKEKIWDKSLIVLTGLQGRKQILPTEPNAKNLQDIIQYQNIESLKSMGTRISLMIKPPQKNSDKSSSWSIDRFVNLADVGRTLFDFLKDSDEDLDKFTSSDSPFFQFSRKISLKKTLQSNVSLESSTRPFIIENAWLTNQNENSNSLYENTNSEISFAVRYDSALYLKKNLKYYFNSLIDPLEQTPIAASSAIDVGRIDILAKMNLKSNSNTLLKLECDYEQIEKSIHNHVKSDMKFKSVNLLVQLHELKNDSKSELFKAKLEQLEKRLFELNNYEIVEKLNTQMNFEIDYNFNLKRESECIEKWLNHQYFSFIKSELNKSQPKR